MYLASELELVRFHVYPAAAEADAFGFQTQPLLNRVIAAQLDFAAGAEHALPGQSKGTMQDARYLAGMAWEACSFGNCTVS